MSQFLIVTVISVALAVAALLAIWLLFWRDRTKRIRYTPNPVGPADLVDDDEGEPLLVGDIAPVSPGRLLDAAGYVAYGRHRIHVACVQARRDGASPCNWCSNVLAGVTDGAA